MERLLGLQILRFLAASLVVWAHANDAAKEMGTHPVFAGHLENFGAVGVDIFFVLSGFIIATAAFRNPPAGDFLSRRISRVVPIYYLLTLPMLMFQLWDGRIDYRALFVTFTFWPALPDRIKLPMLDVGWTLCFEMLFYVAVAAILARKRLVWPIMALFGLCAAINTVSTWPVTQFLGNAIIIEFLFGVGIAFDVDRWGYPRPLYGALLVGAGLLALAASTVTGYGNISEVDSILKTDSAWLRIAIWGIPGAGIIWGCLGLERHVRGLRLARPLAFLGDASYALYLCHVPAIRLMQIALAPFAISAWLLIGLLLSASIVTSVVLYLFIERPMLDMFRQRRPMAWALRVGRRMRVREG